MDVTPNTMKVAALIGDPSRITMLIRLIGGKAIPATELAHAAGISPQTASTHLAKLVEGGLLTYEMHGRHKYFRLANSEVALALEALQAIAPQKPVRSLRESDQLKALHYARTCYDHLAGRIGVALNDRLHELKWIEEAGTEYELTAEGRLFLQDFGINVELCRAKRRRFARPCLDWSERRHHLAGSLGAALTGRFFELEWTRRLPDGRAVSVTEAGKKGLEAEFGIVIGS
ncbi:winged helix-turn-helix domain-containing protein [Paenibacillus sp. P96]|uniref:Winged helix-turn-helix domain-containing protein n=1 Tax=Paenibacillus zeirhizosphaerae TaxID=2987519 RepID=A0ABT9FL00_9BACL|nr:winged helix-turn-helix domain-containing protein [Paenibacillus sp. P96]MDP4095398.1 winged helix-turn-helix domain-containing protein [Paenibacillus sp. P96]